MNNKEISKNTLKNTSEEDEVDLGNLFKVIGKGINNFLNFIGNVVQNVFHYFILLLIFLKSYALKLGLALLLGFLVGFILHKLDQKNYVSTMIVETNYRSGVQLYKQIGYLNSLIKKKDSVSLASVLNISPAEASKLSSLKITAFQPKRNLYIAYDEYLKDTDTIYTKNFKFEDFKKRMSDYDLRFHSIEINSYLKTVFSKLTPEIIRLVENEYYKKNRSLKLNEINQKLSVLNKNLIQIDTLRKTYKEVSLKEAEKISSSSAIEISKNESKKEENDIRLFAISNDVLMNISLTNKDLIRNNKIINIISDFDKIGVPDKNIAHKKYFQFALLFFGLMLGWILLMQLNQYLMNYKNRFSK